MKAQISPELRTVLRDPKASRALSDILVKGGGGEVSVNGRKYKVLVGSEALKQARSR